MDEWQAIPLDVGQTALLAAAELGQHGPAEVHQRGQQRPANASTRQRQGRRSAGGRPVFRTPTVEREQGPALDWERHIKPALSAMRADYGLEPADTGLEGAAASIDITPREIQQLLPPGQRRAAEKALKKQLVWERR